MASLSVYLGGMVAGGMVGIYSKTIIQADQDCLPIFEVTVNCFLICGGVASGYIYIVNYNSYKY
jgi:hypothetical protein